jgi:hypothetical protein
MNSPLSDNLHDPHYVPYGTINLDSECWRKYQHDEKTLKLSEEIKEILDKGLIAVVRMNILDELAFDVACECGLDHVRICSMGTCHWSSIAICMMIHGAMSKFPEEGIVRFYKSEYDNEPYYGDNVVNVPDRKCRWGRNELKSRLSKPVAIKPEIIKEEPMQFSLF